MIDLHMHSIFSDGDLIPSELIRRASVIGYTAMAITDHADQSNLDFIVPRIVEVCATVSPAFGITVVAGIELTHIPPQQIAGLAEKARQLGAKIIVVHGETIAEPVMPGTNHAALQAPIDILAHPGLISADDAALAGKNSICLEISARKGHCLTNGHVVGMARAAKAKLVLNTDSHTPGDMIRDDKARKIARGAGLPESEVHLLFENSEFLVKKATS